MSSYNNPLTENDKTTSTKPLVSIITVVYNGYPAVENTIKSVINHLTSDVEYIVIDGGSDDGTVDIIRKYEPYIQYWISEPDQGIYDALNKGIRSSRGYYIYTLNTGDSLLTLPLNDLATAKDQNADVVLFWVRLSNGIVFKCKTDFRMRIGNTIHHQGVFYRNHNLEYDTRFRVYADFDLNQRLYRAGRKFIRFDKTISFHSLDGISNSRQHVREYRNVIRKNFGLLHMVVGYIYFRISDARMYLTTLFRNAGKQNPGPGSSIESK